MSRYHFLVWLLVLTFAEVACAEPVEIDIEKIRNRYWARGKEEKRALVQNRTLTKGRKVELGAAFAGIGASAYSVTRTLGLTAGYHFTEMYSLHVSAEKAFTGPTHTREVYERESGRTVSVKEARAYVSAEARASVLYGKVNFVEDAVWYLDGYLSGGVGAVFLNSGTEPMASIGIGQQVHLSNSLAINAAYKFYWYPAARLAGAAFLGVSVLW